MDMKYARNKGLLLNGAANKSRNAEMQIGGVTLIGKLTYENLMVSNSCNRYTSG